MDIPADGLRLSLGCGKHTPAGWFCVDKAQHPEADRPVDLISDVRKVDLPDACASDIVAIHLWEHLYRWECDAVIEEWRRLLRPRGRLVLEMPDLLKFCRNILEGREGRHPGQMGMWAMYGDPRTCDPLMVHKWGWTFDTLAPFLREHGFGGVRERSTQWHPVGREHRDFRIEAVRA